ncbi:MAG TPA: UvrB/UvrC motif-containing protein [Kiritimatiellia bacterium]|nr:UvrB/UvrC motif-containing protein [Kiritimatiellia bacterium]
MLCESCKERDATVHLTQVVDGAIKKLHLCEECAAKSGFDIQGPLSITDILLGMGIEKPVDKPESERTCPRCHMRRTDFKKTGRFGCAACYEAFAEELPPLLKAMHRSDHHTGKVPSRESVRVQASAELAQLQQKMDKAIAAENFEEAARLRDSILACRQRLSEPQQRGAT